MANEDLASLHHIGSEAVDVAGLRVLSRSVHGVQRSGWPTDLRHNGAVTGVEGYCRLIVFSVVVRGVSLELVVHRHGAADLRLASAVGPGAVVVVEVDVSGSGSGMSNLARTHFLVFEQQRGDDVGESKGDSDDAGADDDLWDLRRYAGRIVDAAVEATKEVAADEDHYSTEPSESSIGAEHWPGSGDEGLTLAPEADLSKDEKGGEEEDEGVDDVGEELEAVG